MFIGWFMNCGRIGLCHCAVGEAGCTRSFRLWLQEHWLRSGLQQWARGRRSTEWTTRRRKGTCIKLYMKSIKDNYLKIINTSHTWNIYLPYSLRDEKTFLWPPSCGTPSTIQMMWRRPAKSLCQTWGSVIWTCISCTGQWPLSKSLSFHI